MKKERKITQKMKKAKLPYKNAAWECGLRKKKEQELFFEIDNEACGKVYGYYYNHSEINKVLVALISHNTRMDLLGFVLKAKIIKSKKSKE